MTEEKIVVGQNTPYPLNGLKTLPDDSGGPWPAVVLVQGSGSTNMDEKIFQNRPFRDLAKGLAFHGIVSIRYDKRSFVYGRKMMKNPAMTVFEETVEDAVHAARLLQKDPRVDPDRVFLIGHSMGGMLAPCIDVNDGCFAGLIVMAGTPRRLEDVLFEQLEKLGEVHRGLYGLLIRRQYKKIKKNFEGLYELSGEEAMSRKVMGGVRAWYFKNLTEHTFPVYLSRCDKPMLILQGEKDIQVKASVDFAAFKTLLAGRDNVTFRLYPELNHIFMKAVYGLPEKAMKEYKIPSHVDQVVVDDIADWIKKREETRPLPSPPRSGGE